MVRTIQVLMLSLRKVCILAVSFINIFVNIEEM